MESNKHNHNVSKMDYYKVIQGKKKIIDANINLIKEHRGVTLSSVAETCIEYDLTMQEGHRIVEELTDQHFILTGWAKDGAKESITNLNFYNFLVQQSGADKRYLVDKSFLTRVKSARKNLSEGMEDGFPQEDRL